jgi:hypothetical protein
MKPKTLKTPIGKAVNLKKNCKRVGVGDGFVDVEPIYLKNINKDYGITEDIIKGLVKYKLFPTIFDWEGPKPFLAKHELLELIEKMFTLSMEQVERVDSIRDHIQRANLVIEMFNISIENAPVAVKEWLGSPEMAGFLSQFVAPGVENSQNA